MYSTLLLAKFWRPFSLKKGSPWRLPHIHEREDVEGYHLIHKLMVYLHLQIQSSSQLAWCLQNHILYHMNITSIPDSQKKIFDLDNPSTVIRFLFIFFFSISIMTSHKIAAFRRHSNILQHFTFHQLCWPQNDREQGCFRVLSLHDRHNDKHADSSQQQYTQNNKETALSHSARKLAEASHHFMGSWEQELP